MKLIDSHCHLEFDSYNEDREQVFQRIEEQLELAIQVASDVQSNKKVLEYCQKYPFIYGVLGLHPHDSKDFNQEFLNWLEENISHPKILAVGEIGLDYYKVHSPIETQKKVFRELLQFAKSKDKPVVIHSRDAFYDIIKILKEEKMEKVLFHCFSGDYSEARQVLDLGYKISLSGTITYPKNSAGQEVARLVPLETLMVETDSPFLSPQAYRGKRNEPVYVEFVAKKIAELKIISFEQVVETTTKNVKDFFGIKS